MTLRCKQSTEHDVTSQAVEESLIVIRSSRYILSPQRSFRHSRQENAVTSHTYVNMHVQSLNFSHIKTYAIMAQRKSYTVSYRYFDTLKTNKKKLKSVRAAHTVHDFTTMSAKCCVMAHANRLVTSMVRLVSVTCTARAVRAVACVRYAPCSLAASGHVTAEAFPPVSGRHLLLSRRTRCSLSACASSSWKGTKIYESDV